MSETRIDVLGFIADHLSRIAWPLSGGSRGTRVLGISSDTGGDGADAGPGSPLKSLDNSIKSVIFPTGRLGRGDKVGSCCTKLRYRSLTMLEEPESESAWEIEAKRELAIGNKVNAIKIVRDNTGVGRQEAKELVDAWERAGNQREKSGAS
jgi:hypothetical protein